MQKKIEELRERLNYHNKKYYVEAEPEISDVEFDAMLRELQQAEAAPTTSCLITNFVFVKINPQSQS